MNSPATDRIAPLTSLRFFAAAAIVVAHSARYFDSIKAFDSAIHVELRQGVTFFFVLSGFILTFIYSGEDFTKRSTFFKFMRKRVARLWPLHITTLVVNAILVPGSSLITSWSMLGILCVNALMLQSIVPLRSFYLSFNDVSWSISTEFYFYLSLPLLLLLARRSLWLPLLAVLPIACTVIMIGNLMNIPIGYPLNADGLTHLGLVYISPLVRVFDFAVGVVTAKIFLKSAHHLKLTNWQATLLESFSIILCWALLFVSPEIATALSPYVGEGGKLWLIRSGFSLIGFSFLIFMFALQRGGISKFISAPHWVLLGDISFATYLCHMTILESYSHALPDHRSFGDWIVCVSVILLLSHVLYTLIEKPFRRLLLSKEWNPSINLNFAKSLVNLGSGTKFSARNVTLACEVMCLVGLSIFAVPQCQRHYQREGVLSAREANEIIASRAGYRKKIPVPRTGLICHGVIPDFERERVTVFLRASSSADFNQILNLDLLDAPSKKFSRASQRIGFMKIVEPGEVLVCKLNVPGLRRADKLAISLEKPDSLGYLDIVGDTTDLRGNRVLIPLSPMLTTKKDLAL